MAYVYKLTHKIDGRFYIGFRKAHKNSPTEDLGVKYFTSCKSIHKENFNEFEINLIKEFDDFSEAYTYEQLLIKGEINNPLIINKTLFNSAGLKFFFDKGKYFIWSKNGKNCQSKECPGEGWVRDKMVKWTDEVRVKSSKSHKGMRMWTDGVNETQSHNCPGENWRLGRITKPNQGKIRWTNGVYNICLMKGEYPKDSSYYPGFVTTPLTKEALKLKGERISKAKKGVKTGQNTWLKQNKGRLNWYNNGTSSKLCIIPPNDSWTKGRIFSTTEENKKLASDQQKNMAWVSHPLKGTKRIYKNELDIYLLDGFKRGRAA